MDAHDLRDHLREVDARLQRLGLDEQIVGELVELPHDLQGGGREHTQRYKSPQGDVVNVRSIVGNIKKREKERRGNNKRYWGLPLSCER